MADRLLPPRRSRVVPIVVSLGFLAAAGLLVLQIRSRESERPTASASPPSTSVSVEQQQARDADGQAVAVAPPAAIPDASPALAVRPEAKPAVRAKEMAQTGKPAEGRAPAATSDAPDSLERCRKLGASGRSKPITILTACQAANQVDPNASDVMVILAQVELDRGNLPEARTWARKALDIKPDLADAYVFLGGAEQEAGNSSEAKTAYKKYLELAPNGRYARELRVVLNSL